MKLFLLLSFACAAISFTISVTSIFEWIREKVSLIHPKLDQLIHCPWCLNHYVTLTFLLFTWKHFCLNVGNIFLSFIIIWFAIVCLGGLIHHVLLRAYEPVAKAGTQRMIDKLKNKADTKAN